MHEDHHHDDQHPPAQPDLPPSALPVAERAYVEQVVRTLQDQFQRQLVGVYLFGSAAYGAYEPGTSDLDVQAIITEAQRQPAYRALAAQVQHARLPCPARRLELVLYVQGAVHPASRQPPFEMNYNTGRGEADHLTLDPMQESRHWFLLDIAVGRERGQSLVGPPPAAVFGPIPRRWQLEAIADSLAWHRDHEAASVNSVLNACRGWRYAVTDLHGSKRAGAQWARQQPGCPAVVQQAEQQRQGGLSLDAEAVRELTAIVMEAVQKALCSEPGE